VAYFDVFGVFFLFFLSLVVSTIASGFLVSEMAYYISSGT